MSTIRELLGPAREYLEGKGVPSPKLDAEYLLAHVLGVPRLELYLDHDRALEPAQVDSLRELVQRRGKREPLAYVLGSWSFYGLELHCDARALVPRPETEILVERCLGLLEGLAAPAIVDVGTGTGAIALALAARLPEASVTAIDVSPDALALASENAALNGLEERVELLHGDLLAPVAGRRFDLVASNPPYVAEGQAVDPEVSGYEPALAVYADHKGRAIHERLAAGARGALVAGGWLAVEVAEGQAPWLAERLAGLGYAEIAVTHDLRGIERVVTARSPT
ncbi:MAG: peptide chain release factor N(5)-glutamine methyltransferase [Actinomycetota bacterium]|nr:peptide chain release factor N(5)-glutamine methyltransferase [Actinomycetota bacterium]